MDRSVRINAFGRRWRATAACLVLAAGFGALAWHAAHQAIAADLRSAFAVGPVSPVNAYYSPAQRADPAWAGEIGQRQRALQAQLLRQSRLWGYGCVLAATLGVRLLLGAAIAARGSLRQIEPAPPPKRPLPATPLVRPSMPRLPAKSPVATPPRGEVRRGLVQRLPAARLLADRRRALRRLREAEQVRAGFRGSGLDLLRLQRHAPAADPGVLGAALRLVGPSRDTLLPEELELMRWAEGVVQHRESERGR